MFIIRMVYKYEVIQEICKFVHPYLRDYYVYYYIEHIYMFLMIGCAIIGVNPIYFRDIGFTNPWLIECLTKSLLIWITFEGIFPELSFIQASQILTQFEISIECINYTTPLNDLSVEELNDLHAKYYRMYVSPAIMRVVDGCMETYWCE